MKDTIRVFDSFAAADASTDEARARMTPAERIELFFQLQQRAYPDAFKQGLKRVCRVLELEQS